MLLNKLKAVIAATLLLTAFNATAAVPNTINYQGFLTDATTGQPQTAAVSVTFKLYDALTAGNLLYTETQSVMPTNGTFNVQIGSVSTFPATLVFDKPYWLEISVGTQVLSPRQPLASSATALRAKVADSLPPVPGTGSNNTAVGSGALQANTSGNNNTAVGSGALQANTSGDFNTAIGNNALQENNTGEFNTANGYNALRSNTSGDFNTANGYLALLKNTTGRSNTATGYYAQISNTSGSYNTASGWGALYNNTVGSSNIALGFRAGNNLTDGSNNIDIGNVGVTGESGIIRIGTAGNQTATYLTGNVYSNGTFTNSSDRNLKENFAAVNAQEVLTKVASLPLQVWNYKQDNPSTRHIGPMAQDFAAAFSVGADDKHIATVDESGVALAAIKGLYEKLLAKDKEIAKLKSKTKRMDSIERELAAIKAKLGLK